MNLRDGVLSTRLAISELRAKFWSDTEIIDHLNVSAKKMCSAAQCLQSFVTFNTQVQEVPSDQPSASGSWAQEYVLPIDVDMITGMAYFAGTVFPILPAPREAVQLGGHVGGIPFYFYVKKYSRTLTPQVNSGQIISVPVPGDSPEPRTIIGLYPIPAQTLPIYVWYQEWHPTLKNAFDPLAIPDRFKQGWVAYAVARCKEKQGALQDAMYWDKIHEKVTDEFIEYQIQNGQELTPPLFSNRPLPPYFLRGASTVLVVAANPTFTNL